MGRARGITGDPDQGIVAQDHLKIYKAIVDDAFRDASLNIRQNKAAAILSEADKHRSRNDFKELQDYVFERLEK